MSEERTYLELSEANGSSHKFYEVNIQDVQVTLRQSIVLIRMAIDSGS